MFTLLLVFAVRSYQAPLQGERYTYDNLILQLASGRNEIAKLEVHRDSDYGECAVITVTFRDPLRSVETVQTVTLTHFLREYAEPAVLNQGVELDVRIPTRTGNIFTYLPTIIMLIISVFLLFVIIQQMQGGGGGNKVMSFGKSRARVTIDDKKKITFEKVAGLVEEKEDLQEIVGFLKAPDKFREIGARIPKGVLLVGPPGTGKTLIARAVAGEAGVPFFSISGSDFVEMFVGVGASRVRDLFDQAKKNSPCIVFIDEIDAVGRRRGAGLGGGHDEREQTLNQLLVEMDGFGVNEGVIILAATNRPDILDPAILRPGRFDRRVVVGRPDVKGREEILNVHAEGKKLGADVDMKSVAQTTPGFTGADLENLLNEAALLAARDDKLEITAEYIRKAFVKVGIGTEKKSRVITERERRITAYHEAGHAIMFEMLTDTDPVHMISIISTGMAGGYTMPLPIEERLSMTKKKMEQEIAVLLGGRAAEKLVLDDVTTGASNDIERATGMARNMVTRYGMSDKLGPIQFGSDSEEVFIGRDWGHARNYSEDVAQLIDKEIKRIVEQGYESALEILTKHMDIMHKTAELLLEKEKVTGVEFRTLFPEGVLTEKDRTDAMAKVIVAPEEAPSGGQDAEAPVTPEETGNNPDKDIF
ncbi:MAG: ATP-dependent zinc metalloprotease FtsH [Defluviitaleaceae bacterium]|nr:ATP-dependent zinc metalloprotease FtsH [Defluviitaleaceae bacterium]MCL2836895.1 ATP-dependent zinc metalloprotease FtsH [Defluviitaleaceae bacterium]